MENEAISHRPTAKWIASQELWASRHTRAVENPHTDTGTRVFHQRMLGITRRDLQRLKTMSNFEDKRGIQFSDTAILVFLDQNWRMNQRIGISERYRMVASAISS